MTRENEKFKGSLKDKELNIIEDALNYYTKKENTTKEKTKEIKSLIMKLYKEFYN